MQQFPRKRVQDYVDTSAFRFTHHIRQEGIVVGVEDTISRDVAVVNEVLHLLFIAAGSVYLCSDHSAQLNGNQTNTAAGRVYEDGLALLPMPTSISAWTAVV
jgi:hypothetical protein